MVFLASPYSCEKKSKEESKDQESIQSSTTHDPDTFWECDKSTRKRHIQKRLEVSPFPEGDYKAQDTDNAICQIQTQIKKIHKRSQWRTYLYTKRHVPATRRHRHFYQ